MALARHGQAGSITVMVMGSQKKSWAWCLLGYAVLTMAVFLGYRWVANGPPPWLPSLHPGSRRSTTKTASRPAVVPRAWPTWPRLRGGLKTETRPADYPEIDHINVVRRLLLDFMDAEKRYPADAAEVQAWAVKHGKGQAADFLSTRDGQPYVLLLEWPVAQFQYELVVAERAGKDGWRIVVTTWGTIRYNGKEMPAAKPQP
jgi:hypothetical protein